MHAMDFKHPLAHARGSVFLPDHAPSGQFSKNYAALGGTPAVPGGSKPTPAGGKIKRWTASYALGMAISTLQGSGVALELMSQSHSYSFFRAAMRCITTPA
jgi:hypothetical protein